MPDQDHLLPSGEDYSAGTELHLKEYWYVIQQRRWLIATVVLVVVAVSAIASFTRTPIYKATALVQITRERFNLAQNATIEEAIAYDDFYATQQRILTSRSLAYRVVDRLELWEHPLFGIKNDVSDPEKARVRGVATLLGMLQVVPVRNTQLVEISFATPEPDLSAQMANTLASLYIAYSAESASEVARNASTFIGEQIEKLQLEIAENENLLQEYSQREDIVISDRYENVNVQGLEQLNRELSQVQGATAASEARYRSLQGQKPESYPEILRNGPIQSLKGQLARLQQKDAELSSRFKPSYPEVQQTRRAMEDVQLRLDEEINDVANKVLAAARVELEATRSREAILRRTLESQRQETRDLNTVAVGYNRIKLELDSQRQTLAQLMQKQSETGLSAELGESQLMTVRLVDEAVVPTSRQSPSHLVNLFLGGVFGLIFASGITFFVQYWDDSLHTEEDIRRHVTSLPLLGTIPHDIARQPSNGDTKYLPGPRDTTRSSLTRAVLGERFKFLREALMLSRADAPPRSVLVTSSTAGEGKTFIACHLAACFTQLGKKVLLVDADLRKPSLQRVFLHTRSRVGLTSVLTGQAAFGDGCVHSTPLSNLFLMLAGPKSPVSAELLRSSAMESFLRRATEQFDMVIVDSAPLHPVVDSHALVRLCDAAILVTRSGYTNRQAVQVSQELVENENVKLTGVLLNGVDFEDYAQSHYSEPDLYGRGRHSHANAGGAHA